MKRFAMCVILLCVCGAVRSETDSDRLASRVSLDLREASSQDLFPLFAEILEAELYVAFEEVRQVSLTFENIKIATALDAFCESIDCHWEWEERDYGRWLSFTTSEAVVQKAMTAPLGDVYLQVEDADVSAVLKLAAHLMKAELVYDEALVDAKMTMSGDVVVTDLLDHACDLLRCEWRIEANAGEIRSNRPRLIVTSLP